LSKAKKGSLEEVKRHSRFLLEKNRQLMEDIQEKDAETSRCARDLLQQYDMFGTIIATLQDSSQNQVGVMKAELQEAEKTVDKSMGKLDQELSRMTTRVHTLQEELNFLRTYMDKEYPVKSVQIASLLRSIKDLNEEQQDELEEAKETATLFLQTITENIKGETDKILQAVIDERLLDYQGGLQQMDRNNQELRRQIETQQKIIDDLEKDIHVLHTDTMMFHNALKPPRCVIFEDVLLQRPICTPDMEIVLNIPTEGDLLL
ncbi:uncharacterized protein C20orf96 homolog, partial [Sphaerodactylus townsendi]|uniref:uncharacterized protein C20orf96 homolog n=1 Tax=Sphaerodactylus townsendi TaxID=933632 RepID=UPI0020268B25